MIVVADTSPLQYLALIQHIDILPTLFGKVLIPTAVTRELSMPSAPPQVRELVEKRPAWLVVRDPKLSVAGPTKLGAGERSAISLCMELVEGTLLSRAEEGTLARVVLVVDDARARAHAIALGLQTTGTLGVLKFGAQEGLLDWDVALSRLRTTNMRLPPQFRGE
jgi:predicted nucleic acid-binding protein